ncbi:DUF5062 family protein [Alginatibacterium sediminis]|uniref:DUF5062 family protein n=1 Tax=Alginatibacterium sediminis TaxID=2164068 RepID=A0A420E6U8_9ALTE|nr:DUF5062 family protein [Alginatibacterium sediminis]RKF14272.1 DUF5062 family protein [Alginatibacterium sediminis]
MKKFKHEAQLLKKALLVGLSYAKQRGFASLPQGTSEKDKVAVVYQLLSQDKQITPLPQDKINGPEMRHKLVLWLYNQLPEDHELRQED